MASKLFYSDKYFIWLDLMKFFLPSDNPFLKRGLKILLDQPNSVANQTSGLEFSAQIQQELGEHLHQRIMDDIHRTKSGMEYLSNGDSQNLLRLDAQGKSSSLFWGNFTFVGSAWQTANQPITDFDQAQFSVSFRDYVCPNYLPSGQWGYFDMKFTGAGTSMRLVFSEIISGANRGIRILHAFNSDSLIDIVTYLDDNLSHDIEITKSVSAGSTTITIYYDNVQVGQWTRAEVIQWDHSQMFCGIANSQYPYDWASFSVCNLISSLTLDNFETYGDLMNLLAECRVNLKAFWDMSGQELQNVLEVNQYKFTFDDIGFSKNFKGYERVFFHASKLSQIDPTWRNLEITIHTGESEWELGWEPAFFNFIVLFKDASHFLPIGTTPDSSGAYYSMENRDGSWWLVFHNFTVPALYNNGLLFLEWYRVIDSIADDRIYGRKITRVEAAGEGREAVILEDELWYPGNGSNATGGIVAISDGTRRDFSYDQGLRSNMSLVDSFIWQGHLVYYAPAPGYPNGQFDVVRDSHAPVASIDMANFSFLLSADVPAGTLIIIKPYFGSRTIPDDGFTRAGIARLVRYNQDAIEFNFSNDTNYSVQLDLKEVSKEEYDNLTGSDIS